MCMKTSLVERTPGAGRQANFSSGVASASASNWLDTWRHSPSYPCQSPSGAACASKGRALNTRRSANSAFLMVVPFLALLSGAGRVSENHSIPRERMELEEVLRMSARPVPARERAAGEEGLGGPFAEVDGEGDPVAVVAGEEHYVFVAGMAAEDGEHFFGEENRAAPAVGEAHGGQGRVQMADAVFKPAKTGGGLASANIVTAQIVRAVFDRAGAEWKARRCANVWGDKTGAEDDGVRFEQTSPQIGKVEGVERAARGEAEGFELRGGERGGGQRKGELRLGSGAQAG